MKVFSSIKNQVVKYLNLTRIYFLNNKRKAKVSLDYSVRIDSRSKVQAYSGTRIIVGKNSYLRSNKKGYHAGMSFCTTLLADSEGSFISIGENCRINGSYIHSSGGGIVIGNNCVIASGVNIIDSNGHVLISNDRTKGRDVPEKISIGNNVWIGLNSIILKGSIIGDNCVVAAVLWLKEYLNIIALFKVILPLPFLDLKCSLL